VVESLNLFSQLHNDVDLKLIVVNDGSKNVVNSDDIKYIQDHISNFEYVNYEINRGKGHALRVGVEKSKADYIIYTDIDFPYLLKSFDDVYKELLKGFDVVVGVRSSEYYKKVPKTRIVISKILKFFIKKSLGIYTTDTQCGLKGFNQKGKSIFLSTRIERYLFDLEFVYLASKDKDIKISSSIVELREGVEFSTLNLRIILSECFNFLRVFLFR
jgi:glycosyltransferase involved in cell wall biosynthesis